MSRWLKWQFWSWLAVRAERRGKIETACDYMEHANEAWPDRWA